VTPPLGRQKGVPSAALNSAHPPEQSLPAHAPGGLSRVFLMGGWGPLLPILAFKGPQDRACLPTLLGVWWAGRGVLLPLLALKGPPDRACLPTLLWDRMWWAKWGSFCCS